MNKSAISYYTPDGPLHDFAAEAAEAREAAIDAYAYAMEQDCEAIELAIIEVAEVAADFYELGDEHFGKRVRQAIRAALVERARQEMDA